MQKIIKFSLLVLLVSNTSATMMPRGLNKKGNSNSNSNPGLARVNKELGLGRRQVIPARKEKYASRQQKDFELIRRAIVNILRRDDLVAFERVDWKNRSITKDEMLRRACTYGSPKIAFHLIRTGANVNNKDKDGNTPLHYVIEVKVARVLIKEGANVNQRNDLGRTPLCHVLGTGDVNLAKLLIQEGADVNSKNNDGMTVLEEGLWNNSFMFSSSREKVIDYIKYVVKGKNRLL